MKSWCWMVGMVACTPAAPEPTEPPPPSALDVAHTMAVEMARRIELEIDCETSLASYMCPAAGLATAGVSTVDTEMRTLGLSVPVRDSRTLEMSARQGAGLSMLRVGPGGAEVRRLLPNRDLSSAGVKSVAGFLGQVLRGELDEYPVSPFTWSLLMDEPIRERSLVTDDHGIAWDGEYPTRLYRITDRSQGPDLFVAVQDIGAGGYLHLFPLDVMVPP